MHTTYLCSVREESLKLIIKNSYYSLESHWQKKIEKLKVGDYLVYYVTGDKKVMAFVEVVSPVFIQSGEAKVKIKLKEALENGINFKDFVKKLDFIKDSEKWGTYLQVPLRKLSEKDAKTILKLFDKK